MKIKRIILSVLMSILLFSTVTFAKTSKYAVQLFFQPAVMNDVTGEIVIDLNLKNISLAIPPDRGNICSLNFDFKYDDTAFNILTDSNRDIVIITDENTLLKDSSKIKATVENGVVHISYDANEDLISYDGTLCRFVLIAKNVNALWNSFEYYPLRFVENSISIYTYNGTKEQYYNFEGIDGKVGAYNKPPILKQLSINKSMVFSLGKSEIQVNGKITDTDAIPFVSDGIWMLPMRYFAENTTMEVTWDSEKSLACAYGENINFKVSIKDNRIYINSALWNETTKPIEVNGRIYIPLSLVQELYPEASIKIMENEILIYIP